MGLRLWGGALLFIGLPAVAVPAKPAQTAGAIVTTTVVASLPTYTDAVAQYSQVCHFKDSTYVATVDPDGRPEIVKVSKGVVTTGYVDLPDFTVPPDGHCAFSLGIDRDGYLHVTGGMHQGWPETKTPLARYADPGGAPTKNILYWRSNRPESVTSGFAFMGVPIASIPKTGWRSSHSIPGYGWQDGKFITDDHGELYYYSQVDAFMRTAWGMGDRGIGLFHYDVKSRTWSAIGGEADHTVKGSTAPYFTLLFWQYRDDGWQNFQCTFQFDNRNRLHFATSCDTDPNVKGETRLYYTSSDDGGKSWRKANGAVIPGLPLRGDDGQRSQADIVASSATGAFAAWTAVTADGGGHPVVGNGHTWHTWTGTAWTADNVLTRSGADWGTPGRLSAAGTDLFFTHMEGAVILRTEDLRKQPLGYQCPGYQQYLCLDENGLRSAGELYGIGIQRGGSPASTMAQSLLKTVFTPAPLPAGWTDTDVVDEAGARRGVPLPFAGFSGYKDGAFVVNDFDYVIDNQADDFHYVYRALKGDGEIVARVAGQSPDGNPRAMSGLMMRESLRPGSPNVALCRSSAGSTWFNARSKADDWCSSRYQFPSTAPWLKVVRAGSVFSAFTSPDGSAWTEVNKVTVPMPADILVGMSCAGYQNGGGMQTSRFDHVSVTGAKVTARWTRASQGP